MSGRSTVKSVVNNCSCSRGSDSIRQFSSTTPKLIASTRLTKDVKGKNVIRFDSRRNYANSVQSRKEKIEKKDLFVKEDEVPTASTSGTF